MRCAVLPLLFALVASETDFVAVQQAALDKIAEQIRKDGIQNCAAPQLASCGTSSCGGSGCYYFDISFTADKQITSLFALEET